MRRKMTLKTMGILGGIAFGVAVCGQSWAATTTPGATAPKVDTSGAKNPLHYISQRARQQMIQIQKDVKSGSLTAAQAKALQGQIETVRKSEMADLKQNGTHQLTSSQFTDLSGELDTVSKGIPIK